MSEQIQNFSTINPFDDKMLEDNSSTAAVTGKAGPSKIRKFTHHCFLSPLLFVLNDDKFPISRM
jgi:translation initiation factor 1